MFTARAATNSTVIAEMADSASISVFTRLVSGIASVGLKAMAVREGDVHMVRLFAGCQPGSASVGFSSCGNWKSCGGGSGVRRRIGPPRSNSQNSSPNVITFVPQIVAPFNSSSPAALLFFSLSSDAIRATSASGVCDGDHADKRRGRPSDDAPSARV